MKRGEADRECDHREAARRHAAHRAWQRFGLALAIPDLREAERRIWSGEAEWLSDQAHWRGHLRSAYAVPIKGRELLVVFDITLDAIVTILTDGARERLIAGRKPPRWARRKRRAA